MFSRISATLALFLSVFSAGATPPKVLMVSIDGFRPEFYLDDAFKTPTLKGLVKTGSHASTVTAVFPTVTYPNHTTLVTGVPPGIHGILSNTVFDMTSGPTEAWYWEAGAIKSPTLYSVAKAAGRTTASVRWPVTVNADVTYLVPEIFTKPPYYEGTGWELTVKLTNPALMKEILDATSLKPFANDKEADQWSATAANYLMRTHHPDLTLVHLVETDHAQHSTGRDSQETKAAVSYLDGLVGELLRGIDTKDTCVFIVGDHGFFNLQKMVNINKLFLDAGWIKTEEKNGKKVMKSWTVVAHSSGGQAAIYTRDKKLEPAITKLLLDNEPAGYTVITKAQLNALGSYPDAILAIEAKNGFAVTSDINAPLIGEISTLRGQHGYLPSHPELKTGFIASGCGITQGRDLGDINMIDIAPTVADQMGMALKSAKGRVLAL